MQPYLSVVVTARNDDHGGNLLGRMQVFLDAWINQARRHQLPSELILVEWNPAQDRDRLATALRWPRDTDPCQVRIIEVPQEIHARYRHAAALPLYQMIAKNVGIRRARGEFILATNIDVIFSDEVMQFLASRRLEQGRMYRMDRHDIQSDVPVDGTLDEQIAYARSHLIRLFAREGTFPLTAEGLRENEAVDITRPESGIHFGSGWFPVERYTPGQPFRWIGNEPAEVSARVPAGGAVIELEIEPGPGIERTPTPLEVLDDNGSHVLECEIHGRTKIELVVPDGRAGAMQRFRLRALGGGLPVTHDPRILNLRVFRCDWSEHKRGKAPPVSYPAVIQGSRPTLGRMAKAGRGPVDLWRAIRLLKKRGDDIFEAGSEFRPGKGWHGLEHAGAERFRWVARDSQLVLRTFDNKRSLGFLVEPGPAVGYRPFVLVAKGAGGKVIARAPVNGLSYVEIPLPAAAGTITAISFSVEGGGAPSAGDGRNLSYRIFACGTGFQDASSTAVEPAWSIVNVVTEPAEINWAASVQPRTRQIADMGKPPLLHTNACGDFTLMSREHWFDLRGYAELDQFSMHLDSLLCYNAHYAGAREEMLREPMRIYHIEHGIGSGWTPEGQAQLNARISQKGIQSISYEDVVWYITQIRSLDAPVIFNLEDWGLADADLKEVEPSRAEYASRTGR